jgi:hypothetical protein
MMAMNRFDQRGLGTAMAAAFATLLPLVLAPTGAAAAGCAKNFFNCCTINASGTYTVIHPPKVDGTQTCIDITASNVTLSGPNGSSQLLTGPGTDTSTVGIDIEASAHHVLVFNLDIDNFGQGIRIDGPNATINNVNGDNNQSGIVVNGANAVIAHSFVRGSEVGIQIYKTAAHLVMLANEFLSNGVGIALNGVSEAVLDGSSLYNSGTFGIWLNGASNNVITNFQAWDNGIAGVYLGCNPAGPDGNASCPSKASSDNNFVLGDSNYSPGSTVSSPSDGPPQNYGVAVGLGNLLDDVVGITGDGNLIDDALDENPSCGSNRWLGNTFTMSSPAPNTTDYCIN